MFFDDRVPAASGGSASWAVAYLGTQFGTQFEKCRSGRMVVLPRFGAKFRFFLKKRPKRPKVPKIGTAPIAHVVNFGTQLFFPIEQSVSAAGSVWIFAFFRYLAIFDIS